MKMYAAPLAMLALLAGCGDEAPAPDAPRRPVESPAPSPAVAGREVRVFAFGDSLLAGYGLKDGEGYPARLQEALRGRGINARVLDAAVSGDTTQAGLQRLAFALDAQERAPDLAVVSLGGNDMLRGLSPEQTRDNLDALLAEFNRRGIPVVLLGMLAAPNLGQDYAARFNAIYPALATRHGATLVPFFMQPLLENPALVQADRVHPTAQGVDAMVAATIETVDAAIPSALRLTAGTARPVQDSSASPAESQP